MTTLDLLNKLISFPTVSSESNRGLIDFIRLFLAERGVESELFCADNGRKANLFATVGPKNLPGVMLSGHTDVVPVDGQAWSTDPFRMIVSGGRAYGRGTADMKGYLACVLSLIDRTAGANLKIPIHLAFSHDEEVGCIGVRSLIKGLENRPVKPRFAIVWRTNLDADCDRPQREDRRSRYMSRYCWPFSACAESAQCHSSGLRLRWADPSESGEDRLRRFQRRGL
jgi:acetylornithine deacetylase